MSEQLNLKQSVPSDVGELWAQLHAEASANCETLRAQSGGLSLRKVLLIGIPLALLLAGTILGGLWSAGAVNIPAFACNAANGLCTPTPTLKPTSTPQPTYTPFPTNTPLPPTFTPTPTNTPTPTATPLPLGDLLSGCTINAAEDEDDIPDFDFGVYQESPAEMTRTVRSLKSPIEGLTTTFILSNTGQCRLVEAQILDLNDGIGIVADLPTLFNAGQALRFDYAWSPLVEGEHIITLTLQFLKPDGAQYNIPGREFSLALNLTLQLDGDGDTVPDADDCCPQRAGVPALGGCPDGDGDRFVDHNDKICPTLKIDTCPNAAQGSAGQGGCPDSDGDGVLDKDDCCPNVPGALRGCPDSDGDGFPDTNGICAELVTDKCSNKRCEYNEGCPNCRTEYEKCTKTENYTEEGEQKTRTIEYDCNPHEVCTCP